MTSASEEDGGGRLQGVGVEGISDLTAGVVDLAETWGGFDWAGVGMVSEESASLTGDLPAMLPSFQPIFFSVQSPVFLYFREGWDGR